MLAHVAGGYGIVSVMVIPRPLCCESGPLFSAQ